MDTAAQTIDRVRLRLEDPDGVFFNTGDFVRSYNDALDEISEQTEIRETSVYVRRRKWSVYTDLRGILPPNALRITAIWNPSTEKWLDPTTVREMDATVGRQWEANIGVTRWWFMRGLWNLGTYPIAGDDSSPLRIHYTSMLDHIEEDGGLVTGLTSKPLDLPPDFTVAIENYMMYDLLAERREVKKSLDYFGKLQEQIPALKNLAENRTRRDRTPRMGSRR
jgi:hypothetical protein